MSMKTTFDNEMVRTIEVIWLDILTDVETTSRTILTKERLTFTTTQFSDTQMIFTRSLEHFFSSDFEASARRFSKNLSRNSSTFYRKLLVNPTPAPWNFAR